MAFTKLQELRRGFVVPLGAGGPAADDQEAVRPTPTRGIGVQFGSFGHWAIPLRLARTRCDDCYSPERWIIDLTTLTTLHARQLQRVGGVSCRGRDCIRGPRLRWIGLSPSSRRKCESSRCTDDDSGWRGYVGTAAQIQQKKLKCHK